MTGVTPAFVQAEAIEIALAHRTVLRSVSVRFDRGTTVAIVGRNAAGKTTLLRALGGILEPRAGRITWDGQSPARWSARDRAKRIAYVAQRPALSVRFSVRETIELGRYALVDDVRRIDAAIVAFGLEAIAERPYHDLSVGQQQRVALARAWAQIDPSGGLLLDEPFAAMDLAETDRALRLIRAHVRGGGAAAVVVHDLGLAARLADRVWLLAEGGVAVDGPAKDVLVPEVLARHFGVAFRIDADGVPAPVLGGGAG